MDFTNIHIDHIKPISRFNFTDEGDGAEELLDCCNYTNLQPLLMIDNLSKNNKWTDENELYWNENIKGNSEYNKVYL
jgi:5-methylcytosine-specific restriction endonuclease McrA